MKKILLALVVSFNLLLLPQIAVAQESECQYANPFLESIGIPDGTLIACGCIDSDIETDCGIREVVITAINFGKIILGITGSAMLLMFIYGGTLMIVGGTTGSEQITQGKEAIKAAVTGLIIVFTAWIIVNFLINAVTGGSIGQDAEVFDQKIGEGL